MNKPARLALLLITAYRRYISPFKGFSCAYRCHTGRASCSALGFRAVRRFGLGGGLAILRWRLNECHAVHQARPPLRSPGGRESGFIDSCDLPSLDCPHVNCHLVDSALNAAADCAPGCDCFPWGDRATPERRRQRRQERQSRRSAP